MRYVIQLGDRTQTYVPMITNSLRSFDYGGVIEITKGGFELISGQEARLILVPVEVEQSQIGRNTSGLYGTETIEQNAGLPFSPKEMKVWIEQIVTRELLQRIGVEG